MRIVFQGPKDPERWGDGPFPYDWALQDPGPLDQQHAITVPLERRSGAREAPVKCRLVFNPLAFCMAQAVTGSRVWGIPQARPHCRQPHSPPGSVGDLAARRARPRFALLLILSHFFLRQGRQGIQLDGEIFSPR